MSSRSSRQTGSRANSDQNVSRGRNGFVDRNEDSETTRSSRSQGDNGGCPPSNSNSRGRRRDRQGARRRMFERRNRTPSNTQEIPCVVGTTLEREGFGGPPHTPTIIVEAVNENNDNNGEPSELITSEAGEDLTQEVFIFYMLPTVRYFNNEGFSACLCLILTIFILWNINFSFCVTLLSFNICIFILVYYRCKDVNIIYPMSRLTLDISRNEQSLGGFTFYINFLLEGNAFPYYDVLIGEENKPRQCVNLLEKAGYNAYCKGLVYHRIVRKMVTKMYTKTVNLNTYEMIYSEVMSMYQEEYKFDKDIERLTIVSNTCTVILNCMALHSILRRLAYPKDVKSVVQLK